MPVARHSSGSHVAAAEPLHHHSSSCRQPLAQRLVDASRSSGPSASASCTAALTRSSASSAETPVGSVRGAEPRIAFAAASSGGATRW